MAGKLVSIAEVTRQEGDRVLVSLPLVGFPPGFQLRPGERITVYPGDGGAVAIPLVHEVKVPQVNEEAGHLRAGNNRYALQSSVVRDDSGSGDVVVTVVDKGSAEGPEQVIAITRAKH